MKNKMLKATAFLSILSTIVFIVQPKLFVSDLGETEEYAIHNQEEVQDVANYAEGYDSLDFSAFDQGEEEMFPVEAQDAPDGIWEDLLQLEFDIHYDESIDDIAYRPIISSKIEAYNGTIVTVPGFIIPYEIVANSKGEEYEDGEMFMFSAFPIKSCFFCGEAGPESIMEVFPTKTITYDKKKIFVQGRLKLNRTDFLRAPYILEDAKLIIE